MWFSLFAAVLILAIAFYEGLQGLFSGLINCVLAILSAALAFSLYEDLYFGMLREWQPDHGRAIALLSIFILTLLVLRTLFDMFIKDSMQFPVYVDRAGGGIFGFFTGMIVVGMLSIGFEMLPFGDSFLGYSRQQLTHKDDGKPIDLEKFSTDELPKIKYTRSSAWLHQDDFTIALVSHLSANALKGQQTLAEVHPNLLDEAYFSQARLYKEEMPTASPKISIKVDSYRDLPANEFYGREPGEEKDGKKQYKLVPCKDQPEPGNKRIVVRVTFQDAGKINFTAKQVRLVAKDDETGIVTESTAVGLNEEKAKNKFIQAFDGEVFQRDTATKVHYVDFVFEVPQSMKFDPDGSFVEYKQNARADITLQQAQGKKGQKTPARKEKEPDDKNASDDSAGQTSETPKDDGQKRPTANPTAAKKTDDRGRVSSIGKAQAAIASDKLPFAFTNYNVAGEAKGGRVVGGDMTAPMTNDWQPVKGNQTPIDRIQASEGMRIIQVNVEKTHAMSTLGQAKEFASDKLADFRLVDTQGHEHPAIGVYALAKVGGKPTFELMLLADETERQGEDTFKKMPGLQKIGRHDLVGEYELYYIFQVKPGTKAVRIDTGKTNQSVDLTEFNIEAK